MSVRESADVCLCGTYDLWNGSVVCWVCEEIVVNWDADEYGVVTAATMPGHER